MSPWLQAYLTPSKQAVQFAVKATLAMLLALYVALWCDLERPYWALISAAFLQIRPMSGMVVEKGLSQIVGTVIGCAAGIAIMALFVQAPVPALVVLTLWIMLCTYGSSLLRNNASYGCIMGAVTAMLIVVIGASQPSGIFGIAVARLSELALGALCATLVSSLLWPIKVRDHLGQQADAVVNQAFQHAARRLTDSSDLGELQTTLTGSLEPLTQLEIDSQAARYEGPEGAGRIRASHVLTRHTLRLMATLHALQQLLHHYGDRLDPAIHELADEIAEGFRLSAEASGIGQAHRRLHDLRHRILECPDENASPLQLRVIIGLREALGHALVMLDARDAISRPGRKRLRGGALAWHRDHLAAGLNAVRAGIIFATLASFWMATAWNNGQVAMLLGTLFSAFFASRDNPVMICMMFAKGMLAAIPSAFLFGHVLLSQASGFPMLAMIFLPPLFLGLLGAANPRLMGYCLAFTIGNILLTMPGNGMDFSFDSFINRAIAVMIGLATVVTGFRLIPGFGPTLRKKRLVGAIVRDLRNLPNRPIHEAETRFIGSMADRLLHLAKHDDMLPEDQRHLFTLGLTGLDIGYACLQLRRRLDDLPNTELHRAQRDFFAALARAYAASAKGHASDEVRRAGDALIETLHDQPSLSERRRTLLAGLVERLDLSLQRQAERARTSRMPSRAAQAGPA
ncbi:FUSC family protein [Halomonas elongata]|uniref:AaeB domain protein n=3 Tax=Halomonas elongata TaxID=2746 RepID=E1V667_HALED|nr:FUSC family protein [Halomonas elongata]MBW5801648.1 FUSC family protein [Halomonas elongata]WPU45823.1 FUSC family protein [Halomonas elongata DSM 2581]CBV43237.1 AaeB domain protein [Halomonas elongata DSM 2581]